MELKNKVVVITGGTRGLGKSMALSFIKNEAKVVVCAKNEEGFVDLVDSGIVAVRADVTKEDELQNLLNVTIEEFGKIDIWINNAGIWLPYTPVEETDWSRAHDLMEVNFFGTVYGSKVALVEMKKQGFGTIINILSVRSLEGIPGRSAYCSSKYAANGFTDSLRKELVGAGINVISVYPEKVQTSLFDEKKPSNYDEYLNPDIVTEEILENLKKDDPEDKLIIQHNI